DALPAEADAQALYFFRLVALHEQMHAEAAAYMAQGLGVPLRESSDALVAGDGQEIRVDPAPHRMGRADGGFAFDNELGEHEVELAAYLIDAEPFMWSAFLPFLEAGGYEEPQWWTPAGSAWLAGLRHRQPAGLRAT